MNEPLYIEKGGKKLRCGYTTGSCAAAASKAALIMLLTGDDIHNVSIITPKGITYNAEIVDITRNTDEGSVSCAVIKDGGDDPDVTSGARVYSKVMLKETIGITIEGGTGVGRITKPGLDQPVGEAAINSVPRRMILENLQEMLDKYGCCDKGVSAVISVPKGSEIAEKTFNPRLGILGGISILGTTGIVEPMSDKAITDTIKTEINLRKAGGSDVLLAAPGNYGMSFLSEKYGIDQDQVVMSSNFIYDTVRISAEAGFKKLLFAGHIGKLVKVAGGIKNTHSMYGDHRMEILSGLCGEFCEGDTFKALRSELSECVMTDEAIRIITEKGLGRDVFPEMASRIKRHMEEWSEGRIQAEIIVFSNENTELVSTFYAKEFIETLRDKF